MKKQSIFLGGLLLLVLLLAGCTLGGQGTGASPSSTGGGTTASNSYGTGPTESKCSDGTPYGKCSSTKPLFCQSGRLIPYCTNCGCDANLTCDTNSQQCVAPDFNVPFASISTVPGGTATLTTQVKNIGTAAYQGLMTHRIYICEQGHEPPCMGAIINRNNYPYPIGGFSDEIFTFGISNGSYYAKIMADFYNNAPELNENNNIRLLYFTVSDMNSDRNTHLACQNLNCIRVQGPGQNECQTNSDCNVSLAPDFNLWSITRTHYGSGDGALSFTVKNIGTQGYYGPLWHNGILYRVDANMQVVWSAIFNASNDNYYIGAQYSYNKPYQLPNGSYKYQAIADSNNNVSELNEYNNKMNYYFTINDSNNLGVDLIVNSIPHSAWPDYNGTYWLDFNVIIQNIGNQAYSGPVSLAGTKHWDGNNSGTTPFSTVCTVSLPPMATANCYHNLSQRNPAANYSLWALVDSNQLISELNENNNDKNVTFRIP